MRCLTAAFLFPCLLTAVGLTPSDKAWTTIWEGLQSGTPQDRAQALAALSILGPVSYAVRYIENELERDGDATVRQVAAGVLGEMKTRESIPKLERALRDPDPRVAFAAAKALWDMGDRSGRDLLMQVAAGERSDKPGLVKGAMEDARKRFASPSSLMMFGLKEGAGALLGPFSMGILLAQEMTKDGSAQARVVAVTQLSSDDDPASARQVADALTDRNPAVRIAAARGVAQRNLVEDVPRLETRLTDESHAARLMAAAAILKLAGFPAPPVPTQ